MDEFSIEEATAVARYLEGREWTKSEWISDELGIALPAVEAIN